MVNFQKSQLVNRVSSHCSIIKQWNSPTQSFLNTQQSTRHNLHAPNIERESCFHGCGGVQVSLMVKFPNMSISHSWCQTTAPPSKSEIHPLNHFRTWNKPPGTCSRVLIVAWQQSFHGWSAVEVVLVVNFQTNQLVNSWIQTNAPPSKSEIPPQGRHKPLCPGHWVREFAFCGWSGVQVVLMVNFPKKSTGQPCCLTIAPPSKSEKNPLNHFRTWNKPPGTTFVSQTLRERGIEWKSLLFVGGVECRWFWWSISKQVN